MRSVIEKYKEARTAGGEKIAVVLTIAWAICDAAGSLDSVAIALDRVANAIRPDI